MVKEHFSEQLEGLRRNLILMGGEVERQIQHAIEALTEVDAKKAAAVIAADAEIDRMEMVVEEQAVHLLALQQPVAVDLRFLVAALKINNDLERIGDHAVNIAESALTLRRLPARMTLLEIPEMATVAQSMLRNALDGFIHRDARLGKGVLEQDDLIDELNRKTITGFVALMKGDQKTIDAGLDLIRISRNLERIADLSTNIAEEVIFMTQARVVKHNVSGGEAAAG
jgi:phosphate transport system protein